MEHKFPLIKMCPKVSHASTQVGDAWDTIFTILSMDLAAGKGRNGMYLAAVWMKVTVKLRVRSKEKYCVGKVFFLFCFPSV